MYCGTIPMDPPSSASINNALATYEANIAKSSDAQSRSFLTNVASRNKKKKSAGMVLDRPGITSPMTSPPVSPARINKARQNQRIQSTVQKFEKTVAGSARSVHESKTEYNDNEHTDTRTNSPSSRKENRRQHQTHTKYEYDYKQTKEIWKERTQKKKHKPFWTRIQAWTPAKLMQRRQQVRQESMAQRMPKRLSMGLVGTLSREFKTENLYPEYFAQLKRKENDTVFVSSSSKTDRKPTSPPSPRRGSVRLSNSSHSSHGPRRKHRRRGKKTKTKKNDLPNTKRSKAKRRNSTGRARFADEPVVNLYWNPAGQDDPDNDDLAQSTWRHDEHATFTEDYQKDTPSAQQNNYHTSSDETPLDRLQRKGLMQRRKSTGWTRFAQEPTHWLYTREDEEIEKADIPEQQTGDHGMGTSKHKAHKRNRGKKGTQQGQRQTTQDFEKNGSITGTPKAFKFQQQQDQDDDREPPIIVLPQAIPVHEEQTNSPLRSVQRRLSTGAVPMDKEGDSRLHRKQRIRREHKSRTRGLLRRERDSVYSPSNSPGKPRKASLMGLLDPMAALADDAENPKSYLAGGEDFLFTFAPLRTSSTSPASPHRYESGVHGVEPIHCSDPNHHTVVRSFPVHDEPRSKPAPEALPNLEPEEGVTESSQRDGTGVLKGHDDEFSADEATFVETKTNSKIDSSDTESSVSLPGVKRVVKKSQPRARPKREAKFSTIADQALDDSIAEIDSNGWGFAIVQAGFQVKRFMDSKEDIVKEEIIKEDLPQRKLSTKPVATRLAAKKKPVPRPIDDDDSDSSITSISSSSGLSSESTIGGSIASAVDVDAALPVAIECNKSDNGDEECSSNSNQTFPNLFRPRSTRDLSFENDKKLLMTLTDINGEAVPKPSTKGEMHPAAPKRQVSSAEVDNETSRAVERAKTDGESTFVELKKAWVDTTDDKKEKKKRRDKEKKAKKKKPKDSLDCEDLPHSEERRGRRKVKRKEKGKGGHEKAFKKDKTAKNDKGDKTITKVKNEKGSQRR